MNVPQAIEHASALSFPMFLTTEEALTSERERNEEAIRLLTDEWDFAHGERVRAIGVRATSLSPANRPLQLDLFGREEARLRRLRLDQTIDALRSRFGNHVVRRLAELSDARLAQLDPERDNVVHPISYFA
jgi:DNA polymerase-4